MVDSGFLISWARPPASVAISVYCSTNRWLISAEGEGEEFFIGHAGSTDPSLHEALQLAHGLSGLLAERSQCRIELGSGLFVRDLLQSGRSLDCRSRGEDPGGRFELAGDSADFGPVFGRQPSLNLLQKARAFAYKPPGRFPQEHFVIASPLERRGPIDGRRFVEGCGLCGAGPGKDLNIIEQSRSAFRQAADLVQLFLMGLGKLRLKRHIGDTHDLGKGSLDFAACIGRRESRLHAKHPCEPHTFWQLDHGNASGCGADILVCHWPVSADRNFCHTPGLADKNVRPTEKVASGRRTCCNDNPRSTAQSAQGDAMARILVAEDSSTQAAQIRLLLEAAGHQVQLAPDGREALAMLQQHLADLVLTDLDMPHVNGLQLVEAVRDRYPRIPVILMTAFGTDETAVQALEQGAASYVPKRNLAGDLIQTIAGVLSVVQSSREQQRVEEYLVKTDAAFCLQNDAKLIGPVVSFIQETMETMHLVDATQRVRVGVALEEALRSALFQGNLEFTAEQLREAYHLEDGGRSYYEMLDERRRQSPFRDRRVRVEAHFTRDESVCTVRDEGAGFVARNLEQLDDEEHLARDDHRGFLLMKTFMDEVRFNESGHAVTLVKRRQHSL